MTRKSLTRGHVAFDTSSFFRKIAVCLDSPYLQQIASVRKMPHDYPAVLMDGNLRIYATRLLRIANSRCSSNSVMKMMITPSHSNEDYTKSRHTSLATAYTYASHGSSRSTIVHVFGTI